jgi:RNA polymerase sigma-70 factor (ECF subfamily)
MLQLSPSELHQSNTFATRLFEGPDEREVDCEQSIDQRIQRAAWGDRAAAQELLRELLPRVGNLVRYLIGRDADVEDITQRVLVEILNSLRTFRGESKFTTWTDRITVRTTLSYVKRRRLRFARLRFASTEVEIDREAERVSPERCYARQEAVRALDGFPEEQRVALVLHYMVGLSVPELADKLGVPFETVRSRLRIGMQKLRKHFGLIEDAV